MGILEPSFLALCSAYFVFQNFILKLPSPTSICLARTFLRRPVLGFLSGCRFRMFKTNLVCCFPRTAFPATCEPGRAFAVHVLSSPLTERASCSLRLVLRSFLACRRRTGLRALSLTWFAILALLADWHVFSFFSIQAGFLSVYLPYCCTVHFLKCKIKFLFPE